MTWHDLTFTASHVLTASDMNRMQANFAALAHGESGAPAFAVNSLTVTGVASIATLHVSGEATLAGGGLPTGAVIPYAGTAAPAGWLLCAGQAVSRAAYAALFALIGETFGAGDGGTTFNVPDLRGRTVVALDNLGGISANAIGAAWADALGGAGGADTHHHALGSDGYAKVTPFGDAVEALRRATPDWTANRSTTGTGGGSSTSVNRGAELGGATDSAGALPPSIALGYIIKT